MLATGVELGNAIDRDPIALLDGERVIGRFELDTGANAVTQMEARLEILRARIERQLSRQPAEERSEMGAHRQVQTGLERSATPRLPR